MIFPVVRELAADGIPVATACRVLEVSTSGFYEWDSRPASDRAWDQAHLMHAIREVHAASCGTYGHRRVHAELVLGQHLSVSHGRVERLMRCAGLQGVHRRRLRGCTRRDQAATPSADLVERTFRPAAPDRLYVADITQHRVGHPPSLSAPVNGRIVQDVVLDRVRRHRQPVDLTLTGPAGGRYRHGAGGTVLEMDAVEICRILSGRSPGDGLLKTKVLF